MTSHADITKSLEDAKSKSGVALIPFFTAGYPSMDQFKSDLIKISSVGDVVEVGIPFSDPMSDGMTIQRSSHEALQNGVSLSWIFDEIDNVKSQLKAPIVFMSYLNPLMAFGYDKLVRRARDVGVCGFIVPDLPLEESDELRYELDKEDLGLIQLISPTTPEARMATLSEASKGFIYAVTMTGITGSDRGLAKNLTSYLSKISEMSDLPVCAGFGIRSARDVSMIGQYADGAIVGSALVETMEKKQDIIQFLKDLRQF